MRKVYCTVLVAGLLVLWDVTFVWWLGDGLEGLAGEQRAVAEEFLVSAPVQCLDHPLMRGLVRHLHVSVGHERGDCSGLPMERGGFITGRSGGPPARLHSWFGPPPVPPYDVWLDVYTVLGLPLTQISQKACQGTVWCVPREQGRHHRAGDRHQGAAHGRAARTGGFVGGMISEKGQTTRYGYRNRNGQINWAAPTGLGPIMVSRCTCSIARHAAATTARMGAIFFSANARLTRAADRVYP